MEQIIASRLQRLVSKPLEFWPFQPNIPSDERAIRASRGLLYMGLVHAFQSGSLQAGLWFGVGAVLLLLLCGRPSSIRLDDASLASTPNPAGNALVGDLRGRNPDVPGTNPSQSLTDFVDRMQNPIRNDDYAILPVTAPTQAHQVFSATTPDSEIPPPRAATTLAYIPR